MEEKGRWAQLRIRVRREFYELLATWAGAEGISIAQLASRLFEHLFAEKYGGWWGPVRKPPWDRVRELAVTLVASDPELYRAATRRAFAIYGESWLKKVWDLLREYDVVGKAVKAWEGGDRREGEVSG